MHADHGLAGLLAGDPLHRLDDDLRGPGRCPRRGPRSRWCGPAWRRRGGRWPRRRPAVRPWPARRSGRRRARVRGRTRRPAARARHGSRSPRSAAALVEFGLRRRRARAGGRCSWASAWSSSAASVLSRRSSALVPGARSRRRARLRRPGRPRAAGVGGEPRDLLLGAARASASSCAASVSARVRIDGLERGGLRPRRGRAAGWPRPRPRRRGAAPRPRRAPAGARRRCQPRAGSACRPSSAGGGLCSCPGRSAASAAVRRAGPGRPARARARAGGPSRPRRA